MKRKVVWSSGARAEYLAIIGYIAKDNPDAALRVAERVDRVAENLGAMTTGRRGRVEGTFEKVLPGLPFIVAYEVIEVSGEERIAILHVIHGARDWSPGEWPRD